MPPFFIPLSKGLLVGSRWINIKKLHTVFHWSTHTTTQQQFANMAKDHCLTPEQHA